jgi:hypothetical protein
VAWSRLTSARWWINLAKNLGVQEQVAAARSKLQQNAGAVQGAAAEAGVTLPASSGQLVIMRSSQLKTVQDIASAIKGLAIALPLITFALFILAVWLAKDRRRRAVRMTGWCFVFIGLITLLARRVLGNYIVNTLVKNPDNKTAVHDVWTIGTTILYDIAVVLVIFGLILVAAAWLAGDTRPATALRRAMAPTLRDRPATAYVTVFAALLRWSSGVPRRRCASWATSSPSWCCSPSASTRSVARRPASSPTLGPDRR